MHRVEIVPIELPKDAERFVKAWWPIYADDPMWVAPLIFERKAFFDPAKNPYHKHADIQCFMAYRDGQAVGTISAQVDHSYQDIEPGVGFFGFFEFTNDAGIARCLMNAACAWLEDRGMREARGPFNFNTNHEFGCLIDGFDTPPVVLNPHNRSYYPDVYEAIGMTKSKDWYAYWLDNGAVPARIGAIAERFMKRNPQVTLRKLDLKHYEREAAIVKEIYNDAWQDNWGHAHLSDEEFDFMAKGLKEILDPDLAWVAEVDGTPAAVAITLPDLNQAIKPMNGRLFPFGWLRFLLGKRKSRIDALRVWILGVRREYQHLPLGAPLYHQTWLEGKDRPIRGAEASLILEDNHRMRSALEKLGGHIYKTYRIWSRVLVEEEPEDLLEDADTEAIELIPEMVLPEAQTGLMSSAELDRLTRVDLDEPTFDDDTADLETVDIPEDKD